MFVFAVARPCLAFAVKPTNLIYFHFHDVPNVHMNKKLLILDLDAPILKFPVNIF
jgi:hypothetical protein